MEVLCFTDLYNTLGQHERAVDAICKGCRWLQGRVAESFWDVCDGDWEFDLVIGGEMVRENLDLDGILSISMQGIDW